MTKAKRVHTSNDAGALAMSPNVRAMRGARRDARDDDDDDDDALREGQKMRR